MPATALSVQFKVNDLDSSYEIIGTSSNYSFKKAFPGRTIATSEGEEVTVDFDLEGNYGVFTVRVYAKSNLGIRSEFLEKTIDIAAPEFVGTFSFAELRIDDLPIEVEQKSLVTQTPTLEDNIYSVEAEFVNSDPQLIWGLTPPVGHPLEGKLVRDEILLDPFFDKFEIKFYRANEDPLDGTPISSVE